MRVDFFGDTVEKIRPYDGVTGERLPETTEITVIAANDAFITPADMAEITAKLAAEVKKAPNGKAYERSRAIADEITEKLSQGGSFSGASFLMPLLGCARTIFDLLPENTLLAFDECKLINDRMDGVYKEHCERVSELKKGGEVFSFSENQLLPPQFLIESFKKYRTVALQTFTSSTAFFQPLKTYNFNSSPVPSYLNGLPQFVTDVKGWLSNGYRVLAFAGSVQRYDRSEERRVGKECRL